VRGKNTKGMVIVLLLFAATLANAAPTIHHHYKSFDAPTRRTNSDSDSYTKIETLFVTGPLNSHLSDVAAELAKPPADFSISHTTSTGVKPLPQIPRTILMVLTGFICISLVRDRKTWLTILIGLIWIGQAGFNALPQLASHLISKKQINKRDFTNPTNLCQPVFSHRLRSDIEGTYYIGLLHHLAGIPAAKYSFLQIHESGLATQFHRLLKHPCASIQIPRNTVSSSLVEAELRQKHIPHRGKYPSAIIKFPSFRRSLTNYLNTNIEQFIYTLTKLVLISLIRGPPNPT
jgi:hypothetical protein